jgi:hypothetical protein
VHPPNASLGTLGIATFSRARRPLISGLFMIEGVVEV